MYHSPLNGLARDLVEEAVVLVETSWNQQG
jgi:hypothetical protein